MRKEEFFEVLGELDASFVMGAKADMKREVNWKIWGLIAACFVVIISAGVFTFRFRRDNNNIVSESGAADAAPMVYVNDTLYIQSADQQGYPNFKDDFIYLGQIVSDITDNQSTTDGIPKENFQANHPIVGCAVYQYGENIVVKINDAYWLYMKYGDTEVNWEELLDTEKGSCKQT